mmetsp:Transcript_14810/g.29720  ORF Transcript_14810/g.29720 Transcript_14810/m.29720 type:complete len:109 (+) Transcript_14810:254-580(+)
MTSTMLDRFQVNGAQPLLESRVREMIQCQHDARWLRAWDLQPLEEKLNLELVWSVEERNKRMQRTTRTWAAYLTFFKLLSKKALLRRTLGKRKRHGQVGQVEEENEGE